MAIDPNTTRNWAEQESILNEILQLNREIEEMQKEINHLVFENRRIKIMNPGFEDGYSESIESYFTNI